MTLQKRAETQLQILSLGAGVQSSTLALMAEHGEIERPDCAIFADTQQEPIAVYRWLEWLESKLTFPVYRVTAGDLWKSAIRVRRTKDGERSYIATGIPIFFTNHDGGTVTTRKGIGKRHCTRDFKTVPITRKARELLGLRRVPKSAGKLVSMWIGISADEAGRAKPARAPWIESRHPLLEFDMDRDDCIDWMVAHKYPVPPRSACKFCPFHDDESWLALTPQELAEVGAKEIELQNAYARTSTITGVPYFHASRLPILQVKFKPTPKDLKQRRLFGAECEGMCGV